MQVDLRLWPSRIRFSACLHPVYAQGGFWDYPLRKEPRNVSRGVRFVCGLTWPVKHTYRGQGLDYNASYLIVVDE